MKLDFVPAGSGFGAVELARGNGAQVEVTRGLEPGERAILYPTDNVRDGVRVEE